MKRGLIAGMVGLMVATTAAWAEAPDGKALFEKKCAMCHAKDGAGGAVKVPLKGYAKGKQAVVDTIKKGSASGKMKPMTATDEEAAAIADHVLMLK